MRMRICFKCDLHPSYSLPVEERLGYVKKQALNQKDGPVDYMSRTFKQVDETRIGYDSFENTFEADFYVLTREDAIRILTLIGTGYGYNSLYDQVRNILDSTYEK